MAQQADATDELLEKIDGRRSFGDDADTLDSFVREALKNIRGQLDSNRRTAEEMGIESEYAVDDILSPENVRSIKVRAKPFENPRVTVWLGRTRPSWANDSWDDVIFPHGINAYNGKVRTTFDVRPQ